MKTKIKQSLLFAALGASLFSTSGAMAASSSDIVGGWYGLGSHVFTFLSDGEYYLAASNAPTDMEHGTFTWDSVTGNTTHVTTSDTNTNGGLSGSGNPNMQISGNTLTGTGSDGVFTFTRVTDSSNPIVGSWTVPGGSVVFTFLGDGTYFMADDGDPLVDPGGQKGIERGTFTWNSVTGAFAHTTLIDTNGQWGLSSAICNSAHVSGSTLTMSCADTSAPNVFTSFSATSVAPVPVPAAAWLMGSGLLGLIGVVRRKTA